MKTTNLWIAAIAIGALASAATVRASLVGTVYQGQDGSGNTDATPSGTSSATFSVSGLPLTFDSRNDPINGYTIGGWLATGGVSSVLYANSGVSILSMDNVTVLLTGTLFVTTGEQFVEQQDDGLTVTIDGTKWLDNPGPHSPTAGTFVYGGPTGTETISIEYSEIDGPPAVLTLAAVPEPTTMLAGALLLLPLGASAFRILRKRQTA